MVGRYGKVGSRKASQGDDPESDIRKVEKDQTTGEDPP